jgi:signal peptidase I
VVSRDDLTATVSRLEDVTPRLVSHVLRRCGYARVRVAGTSMLPAIRPADVLLVHAVDVTIVEPDDIILFQAGRRLFAHRVVQAGLRGDQRVLVTRGDSHAHDDPPVAAAHVLGRVEGRWRNGAAVPLGRAPRRVRRGRMCRLRFECLCTLRRYAQCIRSVRA